MRLIALLLMKSQAGPRSFITESSLSGVSAAAYGVPTITGIHRRPFPNATVDDVELCRTPVF